MERVGRPDRGRTSRAVLLRALWPVRLVGLRGRPRAAGKYIGGKTRVPVRRSGFGVRRRPWHAHGPCPAACSDFPSVIRESVTVGSFGFPPFFPPSRAYILLFIGRLS